MGVVFVHAPCAVLSLLVTDFLAPPGYLPVLVLAALVPHVAKQRDDSTSSEKGQSLVDGLQRARRLGNDAFIGSGQVAEIEDDVTNCSLAHAARDELRSEKRVAAVVQVDLKSFRFEAKSRLLYRTLLNVKSMNERRVPEGEARKELGVRFRPS